MRYSSPDYTKFDFYFFQIFGTNWLEVIKDEQALYVDDNYFSDHNIFEEQFEPLLITLSKEIAEITEQLSGYDPDDIDIYSPYISQRALQNNLLEQLTTLFNSNPSLTLTQGQRISLDALHDRVRIEDTLENELFKICIAAYQKLLERIFTKAMKLAKSKTDLEADRDFTLESIMTSEKYDAFMNRLKELKFIDEHNQWNKNRVKYASALVSLLAKSKFTSESTVTSIARAFDSSFPNQFKLETLRSANKGRAVSTYLYVSERFAMLKNII